MSTGFDLADVSSQVESFWQELFDGTAYSPDFISSLSNLTDLQDKLKIPQSGTIGSEKSCISYSKVANQLVDAADVNFIQTLLPGNAYSQISDTVNQALLKGMDLYDELDAEFCSPAYLQKGVKYPTQCEVSSWLLLCSCCQNHDLHWWQ